MITTQPIQNGRKKSLVDTVDDLLCDLNDVICELRIQEQEEHEEKERQLHMQNALKQRAAPPPPSILTTVSEEYQPPIDNTMQSVANLPDAFAGRLQKAQYNFMRSRSLKDKYVVIANCSLYLFPNEDPRGEFEERYDISSSAYIHVMEKGLYNLEFYTEYESVRKIDENGSLGLGQLSESVVVKKKIEFQCYSRDMMVAWLETFREVIEQAKRGRRPVLGNKQYMTGRGTSNGARSPSSPTSARGGFFRRSSNFSSSSSMASMTSGTSAFSEDEKHRALESPPPKYTSEEYHMNSAVLPPSPFSPFAKSPSTTVGNSFSGKGSSGKNIFAQGSERKKVEEKKWKRAKELQEINDHVTEIFG